MKLSNIITGALVVTGVLFMNGCDKKQEKKEELTAQENRYIHVGHNWGLLSNLVSAKGYDIKVLSKSQKYKIGEGMSFDMTSKKDGVLYIVYTSQNDKSMLLYPNDLSSDNKVKAGKKISVPAKDSPWKIEASAPEGKSLLTFFVFENEAMAYKKLGGIVKMPMASKDLTLVQETEVFGVDSVTVEVVK